MRNFGLTARVTISVYTNVKAESLEEAIEIASKRDLMHIVNTGGQTEKDTWITDELDGEPVSIEEA